MIEVLGSALFMFATVPASFILLRGAGAIFLAPILSAVISVYAAMLHVLTDIPISLFWIAGVLLVSTPWVLAKVRAKGISSMRLIQDRLELGLLAIFAIMAIFAFIATPAPVSWDARSMWFAIPSWLNGPAEYYLTAQAGGAQTGWPEYPLFSPGSFATIWQLIGVQEDLWLASRVSGFLALSLAALSIWLLKERFAENKATWAIALLFAAYLASTFFLGNGTFNNGYQDATQGLAIASLVAAGLWWSQDQGPSGFTVVGAITLAALNVKQEGFWFALATLLLLSLYHLVLKEKLFLILLAIPIFGKGLWAGFGSIVEMPESGSTRGMVDRIPELLNLNSKAWEILVKVSMDWLIPYNFGVLSLLISAAFALVFLSRNDLGQPGWPLPALAFTLPMGLIVIILVTYAIGDARSSIDWWLGTSYSRITTTLEALTWTFVSIVGMLSAPLMKQRLAVAQKLVPTKKSSK